MGDFSPKTGLLDVFNFVPQGHEKALKQAVYNTIAILLVFVIFLATCAIRYILEPFLRPLLWALLFGSILHPFKRTLTVTFRKWLQNLQDSGTPLIFGLVALPVKIIDKTSDNLGQIVVKNSNPIYLVAIGFSFVMIAIHLFPHNFVTICLQKLSLFFDYISYFLEYFNGASILIWSVIIGYIILVTVLWKPDSRPWIRWLSPFVWAIIIIYLACIAGPLRVPVLLIFILFMFIGFITEFRQNTHTNHEDETDSRPSYPPFQTIKVGWALIFENICHPSINSVRPVASEFENAPHKETEMPTSPSKNKDNFKMSNFYLQTLFWSCIAMEAYIHPWIIHLLPIPIVYWAAKYLGTHFNIWSSILTKLLTFWVLTKNWCIVRKEVFVPGFVHGLWKMMIQGDRMVLYFIKSSLDTVTTIAVIIGVFVLAVIATIFLSVQIYGESVHLVTLTSSVINNTLVNNPELQEILPDGIKNIQIFLDSILTDVYLYSRQWLVDSIHRFIDDKDSARAALLEKQILELWDRIYHQWVSGGANNSHTSNNLFQFQQGASFDNLLDGLKTLNLELILTFIRENIGILLTILDSLYTVIKGNLSLAFSAITAIISLVFGGGTAVLNFFIDFCVFSTALFYLLCSSGESYIPWENFTQMLPSGTKVGKAVEESVYGVFSASFKMASFYGLYTWLIHTAFDVKFVYIPSVLAALCGAIPFLGPYWACLPAVLELWLVQKQLPKALLMVFCQFLPSSCVDSAIYAEIKGGHPYLTGLAIAGGIFWLGFEGALFGPLLLCFFCVLINLYTSMVQDIPLDEAGNRNSRILLKRNSQ